MTKHASISSILILFAIVVSTYLTHRKLITIQHLLTENSNSLPKVKITNINEFAQLSSQLAVQWQAEGEAVYLLQPKANMKTHKEKVLCTIDCKVEFPIRTQLTDKILFESLQEKSYLILDETNIELTLQKAELYDNKALVLIPIYQNKTIIGELYLQYDKSSIPDETQILNYVLEAQVLSKLLY